MFICGAVSAGSLWGSFNGNPIIKVKVNGADVNSPTPAINYNGKVLMPISMLNKVPGVSYSYDSNLKTINIQSSDNKESNNARFADYFNSMNDLMETTQDYFDAHLAYVAALRGNNLDLAKTQAILSLSKQKKSVELYNTLVKQSSQFSSDSNVSQILNCYNKATDAIALYAKGEEQKYQQSLDEIQRNITTGLILSKARYTYYVNLIK